MPPGGGVWAKTFRENGNTLVNEKRGLWGKSQSPRSKAKVCFKAVADWQNWGKKESLAPWGG